jgi:hypothetical protein
LTFTIRRSTAACLLALLGVVGGLALGQVSHAFSATTAPSEETKLLAEIATNTAQSKRILEETKKVGEERAATSKLLLERETETRNVSERIAEFQAKNGVTQANILKMAVKIWEDTQAIRAKP